MMFMYKTSMVAFLVLAHCAACSHAEIRSDGAELVIDQPCLYPQMLDVPLPRDGSVVDENPPWLHVCVPLLSEEESSKSKSEVRRLQDQRLGHRLYFFKLSQDPNFRTGVIENEGKRWSFYNPYRRLSKGTWYWTYGLAMDSNPQQIRWAGRTYSFKITGDERVVDAPPPSVILAAVKTSPTPYLLVEKKMLGKLMPENNPELKSEIEAYLAQLYAKRKAIRIVVDESDHPKKMPENRKFAYFQFKANNIYDGLNNQVASLLRAYLISGEERFKKAAFEDFWALDKQMHDVLIERYPKRKGYAGDFVTRDHVKIMLMLLDAFGDDLTPQQKKYLVDFSYQWKTEGYLNFYKQLEFSEHTVYKAHLWQFEVTGLFDAGLVLARYKPEAEKIVEYAYELMLYRNPAGSRNDGGWHGGNGYYNVNIGHLAATPWTIYTLTGYDLFTHPWYQNQSRYAAYAKAPGNPSVAFGDSTSTGGEFEHTYLTETLAYLHPENPWNLWRMKSTKPLVERGKFMKHLFQSDAAWNLLSIWHQYPAPDLSKARAPEEPAAVFPDIGYVAMHSDITNLKDNLLLNFRSCPYGQINHAHPAQNAFNLAYAGVPLFWRTGYYHSNQKHGAESFKHSRAHNTILPNGAGQSLDVTGYGWIPRFATGQHISYLLGDASNAYRKSPDGNPNVTRFRRHIAMLRPSHVVIYDELDAEDPIPWTFRVNNQDKLVQLGDNAICSPTEKAAATLTLFSAEEVKGQVTDKFKVNPFDPGGKHGLSADKFKTHWHGEITTKNAVKQTRFLTIIEVTPGGTVQEAKPLKIAGFSGGMIGVHAGNYQVSAQLDPSKPSFLKVDLPGEASLVSGQAARSIELRGVERVAKIPGSTLLMEENGVFKEVIDELPDCLKYGNLY